MKKEIKRKYPIEMQLMNSCPNCGQKVNKEFVEIIIDTILKQERQRIIEEIKKIAMKLEKTWGGYNGEEIVDDKEAGSYNQAIEDIIKNIKKIK